MPKKTAKEQLQQLMDSPEKDHSELGASSCERWFNCTGSVIASRGIHREASVASIEGTVAHAVCEVALRRGESCDSMVGSTVANIAIDSVMVAHCNNYTRRFDDIKGTLSVETYLDYGEYIPNGFGTLDALVLSLDGKHADVIDFKYGTVKVSVDHNKQLMLYALGVSLLHPRVEAFTLRICQPRKGGWSSWRISKEDLLAFAEQAKSKALEALKPDAPRNAGNKQCLWCSLKYNCDTRDKKRREAPSVLFRPLIERGD